MGTVLQNFLDHLLDDANDYNLKSLDTNSAAEFTFYSFRFTGYDNIHIIMVKTDTNVVSIGAQVISGTTTSSYDIYDDTPKKLTSLLDYIIDNPSAAAVSVTIPTLRSDICFTGDTIILTDQEDVKIETMYINIINGFKRYTIDGENVTFVTRTLSSDRELVKIEKDTFGTNIPYRTTTMSMKHQVYDKYKFVKACELVDQYDSIRKVEYKNQYMYNILFGTHRTVLANNMIVETLNPSCSILDNIHINGQSINGHIKNQTLRDSFNTMITVE